MSDSFEKIKSIYNNLKSVFPTLETLYHCASIFEIGAGPAWRSYPEAETPEFLPKLDFKKIFKRSDNFTVISEGLAAFAVTADDRCGFVLRFGGKYSKASKLLEIKGEILCALTLCGKFSDIEYLSQHDALTGLYNHGYFQKTLKNWITEAIAGFDELRHRDMPLEDRCEKFNIGLLLFDIDNFKNFNDAFGHKAGDAVLAETSGAVAQALGRHPEELVFCRYGGEEFVVLVRGANDATVLEIGETVRSAVENIDTGLVAKKINLGLKLSRVTISVGAAFYNLYVECSEMSSCFDVDKNAARLIEKSDLALYSAKQLGKNRVISFKDIPALCGVVYDRIGASALINIGYSHGLTFNDTLLIYDSKYNGKTDVINPKTSKKVGVYPLYYKGSLEVSRDFSRFETPLQERIALCRISGETDVPVKPEDRCVLEPAEEKILFDDVFLNHSLTGKIDYADMDWLAGAFKGYDYFLLLNFKETLKDLKYKDAAHTLNFYSALLEKFASFNSEWCRCHFISSDKAVAMFKKREKGVDAAAWAAGLRARIAEINGFEPRVRISSADLAALNFKYADCRKLLRYLRIANFCSGFYGARSGIAEYGLEAHRKYALFYYTCGHYEKALKFMAECEETFKGAICEKLFQNTGSAAMKLGRYEMAEQYFLKAEKIDGENLTVKLNLALLYAVTGRYKESAAYYKKCAALDAGDPVIYNNLAYVLSQSRGKLHEALKYSKISLAKCMESQKPNFLDTLAHIYHEMADFDKAIETYLEIIKSTGADAAPETYLSLAYVYYEKGEINLAWNAAQKAKSHPRIAGRAQEVGKLLDMINRERYSKN